MRTNVIPKSRQLAEAAERQMRNWSLAMQSQERQAQSRPGNAKQGLVVQPFVAVSRETGANAGELARLVATKLNWQVFDRELLDYMAEHFNWPPTLLENVDERTVPWFYDTFGKWLDDKIISQPEYVSRLHKVVLAAAHQQSTVFVGRGVAYMLPRDLGLAVRIIAPKKQRVETIAAKMNCTRTKAEKYIDETDRHRLEFVRRYFCRDPLDAHHYDLVVSLEFLSHSNAADLVVEACRARFGEARK